MGKERYTIDEKTINNSCEHRSDNHGRNDCGKHLAVDGYKKLIFILFVTAVVLCFRGFVIDRVTVDGASMQGTFYDSDVLWVQKYDVQKLERFDIVIANAYHKTVIKRVIGLPNETISIKAGKVYVNGVVLDGDYGDYIKDGGLAINGYKLGENEYFLLGDNRNESGDSRIFGGVNIKDIRGKVIFEVFPFSRFGIVAHSERIEQVNSR